MKQTVLDLISIQFEMTHENGRKRIQIFTQVKTIQRLGNMKGVARVVDTVLFTMIERLLHP